MIVKITARVENWEYEKLKSGREQFVAVGDGTLTVLRFGNSYHVEYKDEHTSVLGTDFHFINADNVEIDFSFCGGLLKIMVPNGIPSDIWNKFYPD